MQKQQLSQRMSRLGTETAYAVSLEAKQLKAKGKTIYPFHIGDLNFRTPNCILEACQQALKDGKTGYCPAAGISELRSAIAADVTATRGVNYTADNISIQSGGKPVIGKFLAALMNEGDEALYPSPGYPIYESQINWWGGIGKPYEYIETDKGFVMNMKSVKEAISPKTRFFIYNNFQNPMGVASSEEEMKEIAKLCCEHNLYILSDEPYYDILFEAQPRSIVACDGMQERTVILYTFSKSFSMTGWRLGAAIGPKWIIDAITKLNTNDEACTTHFIQYAGAAALSTHKKEAREAVKRTVLTLKERRDALVKGINQVPGFHAHPPPSTFYLFVNCSKAFDILGTKTYEDFRRLILDKTGISFCTREHFGTSLKTEKQKYVRFAFSGIGVTEINQSMGLLKDFMEESANKQ